MSGAVLLTDADRFPLPDTAARMLTRCGVPLRTLDGHAPAAIMAATASGEIGAILVYHAVFDAALLDALAGVRVLARVGTGYDRIDVPAARARGIEVTYVPDYGSEDVADHALALLLACARGVADGDRAIRRGAWPGAGQLGSLRRLRGRVLGLLGFGRIGRALAARAAPLGMSLLVHDPFVPGPAIAAAGGHPAALPDLLARADVLSVHVPLTDATRGLLDSAAFARMRPGAIVINTSRGEIIDEPALVAALRSGIVAGAGLDVLCDEPPAPDSPLLTMPGVVLTPHMAAFTAEALREVCERALDDALRVLAGQSPHHPVPEPPAARVPEPPAARVPEPTPARAAEERADG